MELSVVDDRVVQIPKTGRYKVSNDHINLKIRCFFKLCESESDLVKVRARHLRKRCFFKKTNFQIMRK